MPDRSSGDQPRRSIEIELESSSSDPPESAEDVAKQRELLDQVIRETLSTTAQDFELNSDEYDGLLAVGARHRGKELGPELTQELVQSLLDRLFQKPPLPAEVGQAMATEIATSLIEDPTSHSLLDQLWADIQKKCDSK